MKNNIKKLSSQELNTLRKKFRPMKFLSDFFLVYESHIPNTGIVLLNGELALTKKKKTKEVIGPGNMLGVYELLNNHPADLGCQVKSNSELIMIQKSDLMDALADKSSELYAIIKENI
jgi:CRP-like cAMP-binding protein